MVLRSEVIESKQSILIISKHDKHFVEGLKKKFLTYPIQVFISPIAPKDKEQFDLCIFINEKKPEFLGSKQTVLIFLNEKVPKHLKPKLHKNVKIVEISGETDLNRTIDTILWFSLSQNKEQSLTISSPFESTYKSEKQYFTFPRIYLKLPRIHLTKLKLLSFIIFLILTVHLLFLPPLLISSFFLYKAGEGIKKDQLSKAREYYLYSAPFLSLANDLYTLVRPTYLFFSIAIFPDNLLSMNQKGSSLIRLGFDLEEEGKQIGSLLFQKDKTESEENILLNELDLIKNTLSKTSETASSLAETIPSVLPSLKETKNQLAAVSDKLTNAQKFVSFLPTILAKNSERKYLLLFANNMELRPGGGFIGSFGILTTKNISIEDIQIYDVYDADGQLKGHIDPPDPIRTYLHQPHYFLRDSAFSPDFLDNYQKAKDFLEKEMGFTNFSGGILMTTTALQNILAAYGDLYIPDFKETINDRNFYIKAQIHSENNFFPGSAQKKSFLSAVSRSLLINFDKASLRGLASAVKKSLDEKQIVVYMDIPEIQKKLFDINYWSGRMIEPTCNISTENCVVDYFFPVDANLGVNKANFYVRRDMTFATTIDTQGVIGHTFSMNIRNDSPADVFPGGTYKNYFQYYLPNNVTIKQVTKNGVLVDNYDEKNGDYKSIGFYFEILPQQIATIAIKYDLNDRIPRGKNIYQLIAQKQIGSTNNDLNLQFSLSHNLFLLNDNFSPLVKDNTIFYNTNLTADKIFFLELTKD